MVTLSEALFKEHTYQTTANPDKTRAKGKSRAHFSRKARKCAVNESLESVGEAGIEYSQTILSFLCLSGMNKRRGGIVDMNYLFQIIHGQKW